ncbi:MAG: hypothetical protein ACI857_002966 [Arenicella sp.]|jgi:hypothetical protein
MKIPYIFLIPLIIISCSEAEEQTETNNDLLDETLDPSVENVSDALELQLDSTALPERMQNESEMILSQTEGDLDKDGINEMAVVFSKDLEWESVAPRDLVIYKQTDGAWEIWIETDNVIGRADEGGMMGDAFQDISINNGVLQIDHSGGSSWKWGNSEKYRYQDGEFYMIGFSSTYGKPCEYWEDRDYNLSTGDCTFGFEAEKCEDYPADTHYGPRREEEFNHKLDELPKLLERRDFSHQFNSPNGETFYL